MEIEGQSCSEDTSETGDFVAVENSPTNKCPYYASDVYCHSGYNLFHQTIAGDSEISTDFK